jgi:DNA-binding transcriptional regulator YhcF (GntR family)
MRHIYFPTDAIVSLLNVTEDGDTTEIAMVGNEGVVGVSLCMGCKTSLGCAVVQSAGNAYRLKAEFLMDSLGRLGGSHAGILHDLVLRYAQVLMTQMAQMAVCNRHHSVDQQLCCRLLSSLDRLPSNELAMTHELMATMLGVRRESVSEAAGQLQKTGLIKYRRGHITVLDRAGLEERVCECYAVVRKESDHLQESLLPRAIAA